MFSVKVNMVNLLSALLLINACSLKPPTETQIIDREYRFQEEIIKDQKKWRYCQKHGHKILLIDPWKHYKGDIAYLPPTEIYIWDARNAKCI